MGLLDGRVAIITGAGRGLGRSHALLFAAEGARVVVNDHGGTADGRGADPGPAEAVVEEIRAAGGEAVPSVDDVADWESGRRLVQTALDAFGRLDVLVNNAGILRDHAVVKMAEEDWDAVVRVHLKGHFVPTRWAAAHWRERSKAGETVLAAIVNTSSTSGLLGNAGQSNYGSAKAGIAAFSLICAQELARYGVRVNCVVPAARTRLTEAYPGLDELVAPPPDRDAYDVWDPAHVSRVVAVLGSASCTLTGQTYFVQGGQVRPFEGWHLGHGVERDGAWSLAELGAALDTLS